MSQIKRKDYQHKYICNQNIEWLIEHGNIRDVLFFKGAIGDRYTIYTFIKRNKSIVDIYITYNTHSHDAQEGKCSGYIKDYNLNIVGSSSSFSWRTSAGEFIKQLGRKGVKPKGKKGYKVRYCRSAYFMRTHDGNEFNPWLGMKVNLKTGLLVNKPSGLSVKYYNKAKETDKTQRRINYIANRENTRALKRYRDAGGDTESARGGWNKATRRWIQPQAGVGLDKIKWDMIPIDDVFRHRNATLRSNIIEHFGMNAILATLEHEVVDEDTIDGRYYKLLNVNIPDFSNSRRASLTNDVYKGLYLEMINPSTGESHFEGVPNATNASWGDSLKEATVKAALTWRDDDIRIQNPNGYLGIRSGANSSEYVKPVILK